MHHVKTLSLILAFITIISCGGGSKGLDPQSASELSLYPSLHSIEMTASTSDSTGETPLKFSVLGWGIGTKLYFNIKYSNSVLDKITYSPYIDVNSVTVEIMFKNVWALGAGTYSDRIVVQVSTDPQGNNQIINSPLTIPVTCTINGPAILSYSPTYIIAGNDSFTLNLTGTNFAPGDQVMWGGNFIPTTYYSATQMTAQIPTSELVNAAYPLVCVIQGGHASEFVQFAVLPFGSAPPSISPNTATVGGATFTLNVTGSGYTIYHQIQWNSNILPTTYISSTQLTAQVPATAIENVGFANVYVVNPGSITDLFSFNIRMPVPRELQIKMITGDKNGHTASTGIVMDRKGKSSSLEFQIQNIK